MKFRLATLISLLAAAAFVQSAAADPPKEPRQTADGSESATKVEPLSREEQLKRVQEEKKRRKALHQTVASNITALVGPLKLTRSQKTRVNALLVEDQWETAVETFKSTREPEIHEHAHNVAKTTIPDIMRKFMPAYMQKKIMAQRRAQKRRGPPSRSEISNIQKNAQSKMRPAMQKIVMPSLEVLTETRLAELENDEKVLTRIIGDRILNGRILSDDDSKSFETAMDKAGYPASLTTGEDSVLNERMKKKLDEIDIMQVAKSVGL